MSHHVALLPLSLITELHRAGRILPIDDTYALQLKEQHSLQRLRSAQHNTDNKYGYLNAYDRLFRHISLALLSKGYHLSCYQAHQTLRCIASLYIDSAQVDRIIALRHTLKKTANTFDSTNYHSCVHSLSKLLAVYDVADSQACHTLINFG